jgi:hypothetical protein
MNPALVVMADVELGESVARILRRQSGLVVEQTASEEDARFLLGGNRVYDLAVVHINIPAKNVSLEVTDELLGLSLVRWLVETKPILPTVLIYQVANPVLNAVFDHSKRVCLVQEGADFAEDLLGAVKRSLAKTADLREPYLYLEFIVYESRNQWSWKLRSEGESFYLREDGLLEVDLAKLKELSSRSQEVYDLMSEDASAWPAALRDLGAQIFNEIFRTVEFWGRFSAGLTHIKEDYSKLKICFRTPTKMCDIALESLCSPDLADQWMLRAPIFRSIGGVATTRKPLFSCRELHTSGDINCLIIEADVWGEATLPNDTTVDLPKLDWKRSSTLSVNDLIDLPAFANRLREPGDDISAYLKRRLSDGALTALTDYTGLGSDPTTLLLSLVKSINKLLCSESIYDARRFGGVPLRAETQKLLAQNPEGSLRLRLNRLLLEDAYPQEISKNDWNKNEGESECEKIQKKLMENQKAFGKGRVEIVSRRDLGDETFGNYLSAKLRQGPWDLIHYAGHSYFHPFEKQGYLFFPGSVDSSTPVPMLIEDFGAQLGEARFVYLSSCQSAQGSFLASLAQCRVPALLGFSCPVYDEHAEEFALQFYTELFECTESDSVRQHGGDQKCLQHAFLRTRKQLKLKMGSQTIWAQPILMFQSD